MDKQEMETILIFNEADDNANLYTYNKGWQEHMEKLGVKAYAKHGQARTYLFPKAWVQTPLAHRAGKRGDK